MSDTPTPHPLTDDCLMQACRDAAYCLREEQWAKPSLEDDALTIFHSIKSVAEAQTGKADAPQPTGPKSQLHFSVAVTEGHDTRWEQAPKDLARKMERILQLYLDGHCSGAMPLVLVEFLPGGVVPAVGEPATKKTLDTTDPTTPGFCRCHVSVNPESYCCKCGGQILASTVVAGEANCGKSAFADALKEVHQAGCGMKAFADALKAAFTCPICGRTGVADGVTINPTGFFCDHT